MHHRLCRSLFGSRGRLLPHGMNLLSQYITQMLIRTQLNDVISLLVGLWAVKVAGQRTNSKKYTYGVSLSQPQIKSYAHIKVSGRGPRLLELW